MLFCSRQSCRLHSPDTVSKSNINEMKSVRISTVAMATMLIYILPVTRVSSSSCRKVSYNVSHLNQNIELCQNNSIYQLAMQKINEDVSLLKTQVQDLMKKSESACKVELISAGLDDPIYKTGFRGSIRIGNTKLPTNAFPHHPVGHISLRGINLVTLWKCQVIHTTVYDTNSYQSASRALTQHLRYLKPESVVLGICVDECVFNLLPAHSTLYAMGVDIQGIRTNQTKSFTDFNEESLWSRSSFAFVAKKGSPDDSVLVQLPKKQGPAKLYHVVN